MASIYKKPNSPYWYAQYRVRTATGWKLVKLSTKIEHSPAQPTKEVKEAAKRLKHPINVTTTEQAMTKAQRLADALEATARANLPAYQLRRSISALSTELTGESLEMPSVDSWITDHMQRIKRNGLKPASLANYKQAYDKFRASMGERLNLPLDRITPLMLDDFKNYLLARVSPSTTNVALTLVAATFQAAVDYKIIETNPFTAIAKPHKGKVIKRRKFEVEELQKVIDSCNPEWQSMVKVCLYTGGQRLGDVATLRWSQVDDKRGIIQMTTQKKGKSLMIPIFPALKQHLKQRWKEAPGEFLHPECAAIFEGRGSGRLSNIFGRILYQCGLITKDPLAAGKKYKQQDGNGTETRRHVNELSFHSLRYTATTMLHDAGVPPALVQAIVGHDSKEVHEGYIDFGAKEFTQALEKLPNLQGLMFQDCS